MSENEKPQMVPYFVAEGTAMHLSRANHRMLTALIAVCVTFILTIVIFVHGYTIREKNWLDTLSGLNNPPAVTTEVPDGVHK